MTNRRQESIELLEASHSFPCDMTFKVIAKATDEIVPSVLAVFRKAGDESQEPAVSTRNTPGGRHLSITIVAKTNSAVDVLDIYDTLKVLDDVIMLL